MAGLTGATAPELGLLLVWSNARKEQERVLHHMQKVFDVCDAFGAEDSEELGASDLRERGLSDKDLVVGLAASGRTPYVVGGLVYAKTGHEVALDSMGP